MNSISFFHTGFVVCLAGAILFLVITAVLFFAFDIKTIYAIRSGRAQAKTVKEMEQTNSSTGRLRTEKKQRASSQQGKKRKPSQTTAEIPRPAEKPPVTESVSPITQSTYSDDSQSVTEKLSPDTQSKNEKAEENTVVLNQENTATAQTQSSETVVLNNTGEQTARQSNAPVRFEIVKKIICLDTDEVIG